MSETASYFLMQASRCRQLARGTADKRVAQTLHEMAAEYEVRASRMLAHPESTANKV
jgi:hypothetical protein